VRIEKKGTPTVSLAAEAFREECISHSEMDGIPYLPFVVAYEAQGLPNRVPGQVTAAFDKIVVPLVTPKEELEKKPNGESV
jgi:hypothetical protein